MKQSSKRGHKQYHHFHKKHVYTNISLVTIGIILATLLSQFEPLHVFLYSIGGFGYIGAFVGGMLFVSTFTVATGALILSILARTLTPWEVSIIAGIGAVIGDITIFGIVKDGLLGEMLDIYNRVGGKHITKLFHTRYFRWSLPVIGAIIIASPLPDELGVTLMGISKMPVSRFILLSFILNSVGIFFVVSATSILHLER
jgi:uncharacterized membrane protein YdjX (TVP38/TMEM64 family)